MLSGILSAGSIECITCWSRSWQWPQYRTGNQIKHRTAAHLLVEVLALPCLLAAECTHLVQHGISPSQL